MLRHFAAKRFGHLRVKLSLLQYAITKLYYISRNITSDVLYIYFLTIKCNILFTIISILNKK